MQVAPDVGSSPCFWGALKLQKRLFGFTPTVEVNCFQFKLYFSEQPKTWNFFSSFQYYFPKAFVTPTYLGRFDPNLTNARIFFQDGLGWLRPPKWPSYARPVGHKAEDGLPADTKLLHRLPGQKIWIDSFWQTGPTLKWVGNICI